MPFASRGQSPAMASMGLSPVRLPRCAGCMRPWIGSLFGDASPTFQQQSRGKKKLPKAQNIKVRLLKDTPRYGRRGAIIPVAPGYMRNTLYPKQVAEYVGTAQLREMGLLHVKAERDWTFGTVKPKRDEPSLDSPTERAHPIVELLDPTRSMELLESILPQNIDFYRAPITTAPRHSPTLPDASAISSDAQEAQQSDAPSQTSIHGSVTTADISENFGALLAEDEEGSRVVLSSEDITFVGEVEKDRIKYLGTFVVEIRVKGAPYSIHRTINVQST